MIPKTYAVAVLAVAAWGFTVPSSASVTHSTHPSATEQNCHYELLQVRVADASPAAYYWEVRQTSAQNNSDTEPPFEVFPSLASADLRRWVSHLPAHSVISYTVAGAQTDDPLKDMAAAQAQTNDFAQFCRSVRVKFFGMFIEN